VYDNDDNRVVTGGDILAFAPSFGKIGPNPPFNIRFDDFPDNRITGQDILTFAPFFGKPACTYP
jgi:hypothetical protein